MPKIFNNERVPGEVIQFKIRITVFIILFIVGLILVFIYLKYPQIENQIKYISAIIGGLAAISTGYYAAQTLKLNIQRDKINKSFEIMYRLETLDTVKIRVFIEKCVDDKTCTPIEMSDAIEADHDLRANIYSLLAIFENVSIAIQKGYADEDVLYLSLCHVVPYYYNKINPYIKYLREKYHKEHIGIEYEKLYQSWNLKKYLYNGNSIEFQ